MSAAVLAIPNPWAECRFQTCSILPVRLACNLRCKFCFSHSSVSALEQDKTNLLELDLERYFRFSVAQGATRLVITGGGEPLLKPEVVVELVRRGSRYFDEIACFTNGTYLTSSLARALSAAGLSYVCYSRHHDDNAACRELMGPRTPDLRDVLENAAPLKVRATCVMARGYIDSRESVFRYIQKLGSYGVSEFTFKHTYVAYKGSLFQSPQNDWAREHQMEWDPFQCLGEVVAELPWGPQIRIIDGAKTCYYREPTPEWELRHRMCRSVNLMSDGSVYASLEDQSSLLYRLTNS